MSAPVVDRTDVDEGRQVGVRTDEHAELVELRRRNRVLEMEVEILEWASELTDSPTWLK